MFTERENATILAALRLWQDRDNFYTGGRAEMLLPIATNDGEFQELVGGRIDELCEKINSLSDAVITIIVEGGVIQSVDNIPDGVSVRVMDFDTDGADPNDERLQKSAESGDLFYESLYTSQ